DADGDSGDAASAGSIVAIIDDAGVTLTALAQATNTGPAMSLGALGSHGDSFSITVTNHGGEGHVIAGIYGCKELVRTAQVTYARPGATLVTNATIGDCVVTVTTVGASG